MMKKVLSVLALLLAIQLLAGTAGAQPDVNNAPKGENPPNRRPKAALTPAEQIARRRAKKMEARASKIKLALAAAGFTDETLQKTVLDYYKSEQEARSQLSEQYQKILVALNDKATPDARFSLLLAELRASVEAEKTRQQKSFATFSDAMKVPANPRLDAVLLTQGVTGDERAFASQAAAMDYLVNSLSKIGDVNINIK